MSRPKAILFGAIGTLVETSEMQRQSFNAAFRDAGLDWEWGREEYAELLTKPGGQTRIADYAEARGEEVDAEAVHGAKVAHFRARAMEEGLNLCPGVAEVIETARAEGVLLGFATSTGKDTVDLVFEGAGDALDREDFAFIGDRSKVDDSKPAPDIYQLALADLALAPSDVLAIEDTPESAQAALAAGVRCLGVPGIAAKGRAFPEGVLVIDRLDPVFCGLTSSAA